MSVDKLAALLSKTEKELAIEQAKVAYEQARVAYLKAALLFINEVEPNGRWSHHVDSVIKFIHAKRE